MSVKGFQKGHIVSKETREKISKANDGNFFAVCDYCKKKYHTKKSAYLKRKRHFCCRDCYSKYRAELLPKEEQNSYGTGFSQEERDKRKKARVVFNHDVFDLINRQAAEIESLKHRKTELQIRNQELQHEKSEAIKEFAERLKDDIRLDEECKYNCISCCYECKEFVPQIDKLVKEMTEV